jgi:BirA family transcriptional regulator, biotin operon repressor / biotin---[acetyl-CoA-carboxylase] ligase
MLALAAEGAPEGLWLRAERQSAGRGRLGRAWQSDAGNLYASTIVRIQPHDPPPSTLAILTAVSIMDVILSKAPLLPFSIKWPNDILCDGAKLCGILLERVDDAVVIGVGVNVTSAPEIDGRQTTSLDAQSGMHISAADLIVDLAEHFSHWLEVWRTNGLDPVLTSWRRYAHAKGTRLTANLPDSTHISGQYEDIGGDGALLLRLADGSVRAIHAGDVFLV